jgi:hypothetical protein
MRPKGYAHIFKAGMATHRANPMRAEYLRQMDELVELAASADFASFLKTPAGRALADTQAAQFYRNLDATVIDRYGDLKRETYALNALSRRLHEADYPGLRVDAQHVVEQRGFEKFQDSWRLLDWGSVEDMPAMPVMYEWHIRSPQRLPGFGRGHGNMAVLPASKLPIEDVKSLTKELFDAADLARIKTPSELLAAYRKYYSDAISRVAIKRELGRHPMQPFLDAIDEIDRELTKALSLVNVKSKITP